MKLYDLTNQYLELISMLTDPDIDEEIVTDTLEGLQGEIEEKMEGCGMVLRQIDGDISMIDAEIKRLQSRKKTYENSQKRLKNYILTSMKAMGLPQVKTPLFSFTVRGGVDSVVVTDEARVPDEFRIKQPDKIDKTSLKNFLKKGNVLTFAHLQKGEDSLLVK